MIGATIMPFVGSSYYHPSPANEADRQAVNEMNGFELRDTLTPCSTSTGSRVIPSIPSACYLYLIPEIIFIHHLQGTRQWPRLYRSQYL